VDKHGCFVLKAAEAFMKQYCRVMLGRGIVHADTCFAGNFIGADFDMRQDLTGKLPEDWRAFNRAAIISSRLMACCLTDVQYAG
jgi:hypothetical protein